MLTNTLSTPSSDRRITPTIRSTARSPFRKRTGTNAAYVSPLTNFRYRSPPLSTLMIMLSALASVTVLGTDNVPSWTLTTQKSGTRTWLTGEVLKRTGFWKDTSTIKVRYHANRTHVNRSRNNHKYEKVNRMRNEWFTITEVLEHDKVNNRINVQIHGMKNRWIYYLEQDGMKFINHLRTAKNTINLGHALRKIQSVQHGNVAGIPKREELKRGDAANGVYGFRVALQKEGCLAGDFSKLFFGAAKRWFTSVQDYFDAISVRVHLKNNKVDYIEIPNNIKNMKANITQINCFNPGVDTSRSSVVLRLRTKSNSQIINFADNASDRALFLSDTEAYGIEGKKLLKFLVDHAGDYKPQLDDGSKFKNYVANIQGDWAGDAATTLDRSFNPVETDAPAIVIPVTTTPTSVRNPLDTPVSGPAPSDATATIERFAPANIDPADKTYTPATTDPLAPAKGPAPCANAQGSQAATETAKVIGSLDSRRRLVGVVYYSFIGFNMFLMCCLLVGISFAYHVGSQDANYEPIRM